MPPTKRTTVHSEESLVLVRKMKRRPTHPGEMLQEDFMPDYNLTVAGLADALGVSRQSVNELLRTRRALSPEMALRLARLFGNSAEFWLNAQRAVDLWDAAQAIKKEIAGITPLRDARDLAAFRKRAKEPTVAFENLIGALKRRGKL